MNCCVALFFAMTTAGKIGIITYFSLEVMPLRPGFNLATPRLGDATPADGTPP
jgi:hypothetical protein